MGRDASSYATYGAISSRSWDVQRRTEDDSEARMGIRMLAAVWRRPRKRPLSAPRCVTASGVQRTRRAQGTPPCRSGPWIKVRVTGWHSRRCSLNCKPIQRCGCLRAAEKNRDMGRTTGFSGRDLGDPPAIKLRLQFWTALPTRVHESHDSKSKDRRLRRLRADDSSAVTHLGRGSPTRWISTR